MTQIDVSSIFQRMMDDTDVRLVLKPLLYRYLYNAEFPDIFSVTFRKAGLARKPDNYFHPSTHPLWRARQLFYYLSRPGQMEVEQLDANNRMAVTMGTAVHAFVEMCLRDAGAMVPLEGTCPACHRPHGTKRGQCDEYGAADEHLGSRGHMDGVIFVNLTGRYWVPGVGVFEFKTMSSRKASKIADLDLETFKRLCLDYYAQVQEYMRMTGMTQAVVIIMELGWPWDITEIQIPYDPAFALATSQKYLATREAVAEDKAPLDCCGVDSIEGRTCPARGLCRQAMLDAI